MPIGLSSTVRIAEEETTGTGPAIEVLVGGNEPFTVHESLLRQGSPFFDRMLSGNWKEATERQIELPEDDPAIFTIYVSWLYRAQIPTISKGTRDLIEFGRLVKAYIFGDKIQASAFQNRIMDAIIEKSKQSAKDDRSWKQAIPSHTCVELAYKNTLPGSPLRRLLVDLWAVADERKFYKETPRAFLEDLIKKLQPSARSGLAVITYLQPGPYYVPLDKS